ncbi:MAG: ribbon-helix-helix protein, CopG family [Actinomycetota bacterium]|nr:ribbon-helix-helix protein, CopG family [Nocardioidaceae bacterium]MDQ3480257.1 ribbon-helix-helix protein, CopG family [Actinomycetota bacterium]
MADTTKKARTARRDRHEAILAEVAQEEAESAEAEIAEKASALDTPLHLRIDRELDARLRRQAAAEHIPTSALVRRLLRQAVHERPVGELTSAEVEDIARRVAREELQSR